MMRLIVVLAVVCASVVGAVADPFSFNGNTVDVEYWAGGGSEADNLAVLVLDFETDAGSFAFGYGWGGTNGVTGQTFLDAVGAAGGFSYTYNTDWGSAYVDSMSYAGNTAGQYDGYPSNYVYSSVSIDGVTFDGSALLGVEVDVIEDGMYYGWSQQTTGDWPPVNQPNVPVPEPGTVTLFGIGSAIVVWRKRRSTRS